MAQTIGFVVETSDDGRAIVVAEKSQGCGSCSAVSACHGGRAADTRKTPAFNRIGAVVGDRVTLTVSSSALLSRLAILYLLPVFTMLAGAFVGASLDGGASGTGGGYSAGFGLAGFGLGFAISLGISRIWSMARPITPVITRIVNYRFGPQSAPLAPGCGFGGK